MREIYGHNFKWQHIPRGADVGSWTIQRYRDRLALQARGFWPGKFSDHRG